MSGLGIDDGQRGSNAPVSAAFVTPPGGLSTWTEPDPVAPPAGHADGGLPVVVIESSTGWSRVEFGNGWRAWVDSSLLRPSTPSAVPERSAVLSRLPAIGAALAIAGSFLPWATGVGDSINAWQIPITTLLTHDPSTSSVWVGWFLLIPAVVFLPYLTRSAFPLQAHVALGVVALGLGVAGVLLMRSIPGDAVSTGVGAACLGGVVMICESLRRRP